MDFQKIILIGNQEIIKVNRRGKMKILHLQTISELTGIPLVERGI